MSPLPERARCADGTPFVAVVVFLTLRRPGWPVETVRRSPAPRTCRRASSELARGVGPIGGSGAIAGDAAGPGAQAFPFPLPLGHPMPGKILITALSSSLAKPADDA